MYLYLATDRKHKRDNQWFLGYTKDEPIKVKRDLNLDFATANVDFVVNSFQAKDVFRQLSRKITSISRHHHYALVEGNHEQLAQLIIQAADDYESENPSLKRTFKKWINSVDS